MNDQELRCARVAAKQFRQGVKDMLKPGRCSRAAIIQGMGTALLEELLTDSPPAVVVSTLHQQAADMSIANGMRPADSIAAFSDGLMGAGVPVDDIIASAFGLFVVGMVRIHGAAGAAGRIQNLADKMDEATLEKVADDAAEVVKRVLN